MQVLFSLNTGPQCPIWGISGRLILGKSKKFSSLREVRLVSRPVLPENEEEHRTGDGCGRKLSVPFAFYVLLENVPGLLFQGGEEVLSDLAGLGYDAEWTVLSAAQFGAPHLRRRVFIVAYPNSEHGDNG